MMFMMMMKINKQAWKRRNLYIKFIGNFGRNKVFGQYTYRLEGTIQMDIEEILFSVLNVFTLQRI